MAKTVKRGFILYNDYSEQFLSLSDAECGKLIKAIFVYETTSEMCKLPARASMAFSFIKNALDENRDKYAETCKKRKEAGKKSGEVRLEKSKKKANKTNKTNTCSISGTKRTDTDTETETETKTDTGTVTGTESNNTASPDMDSLTPEKSARGEFKNVFLSDSEYQKLENEYGQRTTRDAVQLLSTRIARDNKYRDENHYATIKSWVITALYEQRERDEKTKKKRIPPDFDFDFEDIMEMPPPHFHQ